MVTTGLNVGLALLCKEFVVVDFCTLTHVVSYD